MGYQAAAGEGQGPEPRPGGNDDGGNDGATPGLPACPPAAEVPVAGVPDAGAGGARDAAGGSAGGSAGPEAGLDARLPDLDWALLPDGFRRSEFLAPSGTLAVIALGDPHATPVVLVPGATGSKEDFVLMMPILVAAGYFAVSFDLAGQYESAAAGPENLEPPEQGYSYRLFTDDVLAFLGDVVRRAGRPAHVVGYSFAGTVSALAYGRVPGLFASLTLLSCPPLAGQSFRGVSRIGPVSGLATGRVGAALMVWGIRRNFVPVPPGRLRFVRDRLNVTRRQSVRDIVALMKRSPDLAPVLSEAPLPKLVAVGEHDLWPTALHATFARSVGARLAVYPGGHSPCETSPHQLCRDLLQMYGGTG